MLNYNPKDKESPHESVLTEVNEWIKIWGVGDSQISIRKNSK